MDMKMKITTGKTSLVEAANRFIKEGQEGRIVKLEKEIAELKASQKKKITSKQYMSIVLRSKEIKFPKKQANLLRALDSCSPTEESEIIRKIGIKGESIDQKRVNLRGLVRETRARIKRYNSEEILVIEGLRGNPVKGYRLIINSHLIKI